MFDLEHFQIKAGLIKIGSLTFVWISYIYECLRFEEEVFFWCLTISGPYCPWLELLTVYINSHLVMLACLRCYEGEWKLLVAHK